MGRPGDIGIFGALSLGLPSGLLFYLFGPELESTVLLKQGILLEIVRLSLCQLSISH